MNEPVLAEVVAITMGQDFASFLTADGRSFSEVCLALGGRRLEAGDATLWYFPDHSALIAFPGWWDHGQDYHPDVDHDPCFCPRSHGRHYDECPVRQRAIGLGLTEQEGVFRAE